MCCFQTSCGSRSCGCNRFPQASYRTCGIGPMGPQGPQGPMGPMGPQGPQGTSAVYKIASFTATSATEALSTGTAIPLTADYNNDPADISFTAGNTFVTLQSGTYLISFDADASPETDGTASLSLALNGTTVAKSASTGTASAGDIVPLHAEFILTVSGASPLSLVNTGEENTVYTNTNLVIRKIA